MAIFAWNNKYSVQIGEIDAQHQKLFALISDLCEAMKGGKSKDVLGKVLQDLIAYTKTHFAVEEKLMAQHGYPGYIDHRGKHQDLVKRVLDFQQKFSQGNAFLTLEVMKMLEDWLVNHIQGTDQNYGPFLVGKGVK